MQPKMTKLMDGHEDTEHYYDDYYTPSVHSIILPQNLFGFLLASLSAS